MMVLIISQPVLSRTNNMGKTLMGYFSCFTPSEVAQLYLRSGTPNNTEVCNRYYRFSDEDAMHSVFNRKVNGKKFDMNDIEIIKRNADLQSQSSADVYKVGSKHKTWMLLLRDLIWSVSAWKNSNMLRWISEINPDVIFFAAGDGGFSYRIAEYISNYLKKPLVVVCMDDFYINNRNKNEIFGNLRQKLFMRTVRRTLRNVTAIFTICDSMNKAYSQLFEKKCFTLHTSVAEKVNHCCSNANQLSYIGSVGCGRFKSLLEIGKVLSEIQDKDVPKFVDVYTGSYQPDYIEPLKSASGIRFHGSISADEVLKVMSNSIAVIHTESFEQNMMEMVRFSVSTKIAESLMYGPCLIAFGPEGIASIDYLKENRVAYVISSKEDLKSGLEKVLSSSKIREDIIIRARSLAQKNHSANVNPQKVRQWLQDIVQTNRS